jgi:hypothetical protein
MKTTEQRAEAVAGRAAAIELANELYMMDRNYMLAFCRELVSRMPDDAKGGGECSS